MGITGKQWITKDEVMQALSEGKSVSEIAKEFGISESVVRRISFRE